MSSSIQDLPVWTGFFAEVDLPVLRSFADTVAAQAARGDGADPHTLGEAALADPLACIRLLAAAARRHPAAVQRLDSMTAAAVLVGTDAFFRAFEGAPVLETVLAQQPRALAGARGVIRRAHEAARIAAAFAIHRREDHVESVQLAALLHGFVDILLWYAASPHATQIASLQAGAALHEAEVQRAVMGVGLATLGDTLMQRWGLPEAVRVMAYHPRDAGIPGRTVALAVQLARHLANGWSDAALPEDFAEAGRLLNMQPHAAAALVRAVRR